MAIARRLPRPRSTVLRLAIANIHRPGALTPTVVLSLGLGLALLVTVLEIDGNLRRQFMAALPDKAPSFYFLDIQAADADAVRRLRARSTRRTPRSSACRCCAAASWRPAASRPRTSRRRRTPPGCCRATAASPTRARCRRARAWSKANGGAGLRGPAAGVVREEDRRRARPQDRRPIVVNVLGRNITARIANMRAVDWENLGINFVLVFSPGAFAGAPQTDIAT